MHPLALQSYDTFVTTSFEHIQHDRDLISALPPAATFVFSVACFDDPEHFRVFRRPQQLRARYDDLLEIESIWINPQRSKMVAATRRR